MSYLARRRNEWQAPILIELGEVYPKVKLILELHSPPLSSRQGFKNPVKHKKDTPQIFKLVT